MKKIGRHYSAFPYIIGRASNQLLAAWWVLEGGRANLFCSPTLPCSVEILASPGLTPPARLSLARSRQINITSKADNLQAPCDFFYRNQFALSRAGADFARALPGFRGDDVAVPERPGAALRRAHRVNGAALHAVVKDT